MLLSYSSMGISVADDLFQDELEDLGDASNELMLLDDDQVQ